MPFLPSEGEETKLLINQQMKEVLVFHYLPILWYRYPIPNEIREFWYSERSDILNYMQKAYKDLDIQFLPDSLVMKLNPQKLSTNIVSILDSFDTSDILITNSIPTEILSTNILIQPDEILNRLNLINGELQNFINL